VKVQYDFNASIDLGTYTMPNLWLNMCFESGYPTANGTSPGGGTFYASVSSDGVTWGPVFHKSLAITGPATLGLFECSHNPTEVGTATFTNVTLNGGIVGVED
jgi:hypothetical protein